VGGFDHLRQGGDRLLEPCQFRRRMPFERDVGVQVSRWVSPPPETWRAKQMERPCKTSVCGAP
jgi:hypothetical protein